QLGLFATSILYPATLRRRLTDRYQPGRRVLDRRVFIEFDMDPVLGPHVELADDDAGLAALLGHSSPNGDTTFIAVMLPPEGQVHDRNQILDGDGRALPALSYQEYRVLAGLTFRSLFRSAFGGHIPDDAAELELRFLELLLQYGIIYSGWTTAERVDTVVA